jgi:hypothetical protein
MLTLFWDMKPTICKNWRGSKLVKDTTKKLVFFWRKLKNLWNTRTGALKSKLITLKSNISFVSIYDIYNNFAFFKSLHFLTYPRNTHSRVVKQKNDFSHWTLASTRYVWIVTERKYIRLLDEQQNQPILILLFPHFHLVPRSRMRGAIPPPLRCHALVLSLPQGRLYITLLVFILVISVRK